MTHQRQKMLLYTGAWEGSCGTLKQQQTGQAPGGYYDASAAENAPVYGGLGGKLRNSNRRLGCEELRLYVR